MFVASVRSYNWPLPWDTNPHDGLIPAMNVHRQKELRKGPYNGRDPVAYVKCMIGAYTHQEELEVSI
jgi:hypothetical protein